MKSDTSLKRKREAKDPDDATNAAREKKLENMYETLKSSSRKNIWNNGNLEEEEEDAVEIAPTNDNDTAAPASEDEEEYQPLPSKKKFKSVRSNLPTPSSDETEMHSTKNIQDGNDDVGKDQVESSGGRVSDADWLRSRSSRLLDLTDDIDSHMADKPQVLETTNVGDAMNNEEETHNGDEPDEEPSDALSAEDENNALEKSQAEHEAAIETITQHRRLFVRNLPYSVTEQDLREHFVSFGDIQEVWNHSFPKACLPVVL